MSNEKDPSLEDLDKFGMIDFGGMAVGGVAAYVLRDKIEKADLKEQYSVGDILSTDTND